MGIRGGGAPLYAATLSETSERAAQWRETFGSLTVPIKDPVASIVDFADLGKRLCFHVDVAALAPDVLTRAASHIAARFKIDIDDVRVGLLRGEGLPILAEDVIDVLPRYMAERVFSPDNTEHAFDAASRGDLGPVTKLVEVIRDQGEALDFLPGGSVARPDGYVYGAHASTKITGVVQKQGEAPARDKGDGYVIAEAALYGVQEIAIGRQAMNFEGGPVALHFEPTAKSKPVRISTPAGTTVEVSHGETLEVAQLIEPLFLGRDVPFEIVAPPVPTLASSCDGPRTWTAGMFAGEPEPGRLPVEETPDPCAAFLHAATMAGAMKSPTEDEESYEAFAARVRGRLRRAVETPFPVDRALVDRALDEPIKFVFYVMPLMLEFDAAKPTPLSSVDIHVAATGDECAANPAKEEDPR